MTASLFHGTWCLNFKWDVIGVNTFLRGTKTFAIRQVNFEVFTDSANLAFCFTVFSQMEMSLRDVSNEFVIFNII